MLQGALGWALPHRAAPTSSLDKRCALFSVEICSGMKYFIADINLIYVAKEHRMKTIQEKNSCYSADFQLQLGKTLV